MELGGNPKASQARVVRRTLTLKLRKLEVLALKATGTGSLIEKLIYQDCGATLAFDTVDFGFPTTYVDSSMMEAEFASWLSFTSSKGANVTVIECGGDPIGASVPEFLSALERKRERLFHICAASDVLAAFGLVKHFSEQRLPVNFICGAATDNQIIANRSEKLCAVPAGNLRTSEGIVKLQGLLYTWLGAI